MKRVFTLCALLCIVALPIMAGTNYLMKIDPKVVERAEENFVKPVPVIIHLQAEFKTRYPKTQRLQYIRGLREVAKMDQAPVMEYLQTRMGAKNISQYYIINAIAVELTYEQLEEIAALPNVREIVLDEVVPMPEVIPGKEVKLKGKHFWSIDNMNVAKVWEELKLDGKGIVVAVLDTGIDGNHPEFKDKILGFLECYTGSNTPVDNHGHGSHCAGTILGGSLSGQAIGMAPEAKLYAGAIFNAQGSATTSGILKGMEWVLDPDGNPETDDAPVLVSNSWGSSSQSNTSFWNAVQTWVNAEIFPVFAAGNSGPRPRSVGTPGGFPHSFAVGASNKTDGIAYFSSRGPITWDGVEMIKPDVSAPGQDIYSVKKGGGYTSMSGTSMACPGVAGVIALMYQAKPDATIDEIRHALEQTADHFGEEGKNNTFGYGRINAYNAIKFLLKK